MFDIRKAYGFDKDKANQGVDRVLGPDPENDWVTICRLPNDRYTSELKKIYRANHDKLESLKSQGEEGEKAASELDAKLHNEVIARSVVVNWGKGFVINDKRVNTDLETRIQVLTDYPDFKSECTDFASERSNYPLEEDLKTTKK